MIFEFDPNKSEANKEKHGIDFVEAQAIWASSPLIVPARSVEDEQRYFAVGLFEGQLWTAVFSVRNGKARIISCRRARDKERRAYHGDR